MNVSAVNMSFIFTSLDRAPGGNSALFIINVTFLKLLDLKDSSGLADNSLRESDPNFSRLLWTLPSVLFPCLSEK